MRTERDFSPKAELRFRSSRAASARCLLNQFSMPTSAIFAFQARPTYGFLLSFWNPLAVLLFYTLINAADDFEHHNARGTSCAEADSLFIA